MTAVPRQRTPSHRGRWRVQECALGLPARGARGRVPRGAIVLLTALLACARAGEDAGARAASRAPAAGVRAAGRSAEADTHTVVVHRTPTCECCKRWAAHMRRHGSRVTEVEQEDLTPVRAEAGVPALLRSCHTARGGGYVVEGHVPAEDVRRLLAERPAVAGIAAPGMPMGSPGMEGPYPADHHTVLAFDRGGGSGRAFAHH